MTLKQLSYLVAIVDAGSFSEAAAMLHISQPPLSMQIKALEDELGQPLFERSTRYIRPTDACMKLYEKARSILALTEEAKNEIISPEDPVSGKLIIGVISSCGGVVPGSLLPSFAQKYPRVSFELIEGNTFVLLEKIKKHEIDLAFVRSPYDREGLTCYPIISEPMCIAFSGNLLPDEGDVTLKEVSSYPLIIYRRFASTFQKLFEKKELPFNVVCLNEDARTTLMWAAAGMGCALVPLSIAQAFAVPDISIRKINEPSLITQVELIHRKGQYLSPAAKRLIEAYQTESPKA